MKFATSLVLTALALTGSAVANTTPDGIEPGYSHSWDHKPMKKYDDHKYKHDNYRFKHGEEFAEKHPHEIHEKPYDPWAHDHYGKKSGHKHGHKYDREEEHPLEVLDEEYWGQDGHGAYDGQRGADVLDGPDGKWEEYGEDDDYKTRYKSYYDSDAFKKGTEVGRVGYEDAYGYDKDNKYEKGYGILPEYRGKHSKEDLVKAREDYGWKDYDNKQWDKEFKLYTEDGKQKDWYEQDQENWIKFGEFYENPIYKHTE
ncbi:hypothetical protein RUND412_003226 [Rhizina undulata]